MADIHITNPFLEQMGFRLINWSEGVAQFAMPIQAWHMNRSGALQGGVISTLLDAACSYAGLYAPESAPAIFGVTITLNVNFISSANSGVLYARAKKIGGGRKIFFSEGQVHTEDGILIASGQGSFKYRDTTKAAPVKPAQS